MVKENREAFFKTVFLYGGISQEEYKEAEDGVRRRNWETLKISSLVCMVMFLFLTMAGICFGNMKNGLPLYGFMAVSCMILFFISIIWAEKRLYFVLPLWYLLYLLFGLYAGMMNTLIRPELSSTTLCAFLAAGPLLIIDRPIRILASMVGMVVLYLFLAIGRKDAYILFTDSVNILCCLFMGMAIYMRLTKGKLKEILQEKLLKKERDTDRLTELLNKTAFEEQVKKALKEPEKRGTLIIIDIDDFKGINDTYGHAFGDMVLRRVGACIGDNKEEGEICGRFGGDEFVMFLSNNSSSSLANRMSTLTEVIKQERLLPDEMGCVRISAGAAFYPECGKNYEELFQNADRALYEAKRAGKNQWASASNERPMEKIPKSIR